MIGQTAHPVRSARNRYIVGLVYLIFFAISLITNILGPCIPDIIRSFQLSMAAAALLPFAFFIAYGLLSIPSGLLVDVFAEKTAVLAAFAVALLGALTFSLFPSYGVAMASLFVIGAGMTMLQVAVNPLLRTAGGEEHFAFHSAAVQLVFGFASFLSPRVYSYLVQNLGRDRAGRGFLMSALAALTPRELPWVSLYWLFTGVAAIMIAMVAVSRFPRVERKEDETAGSWRTHLRLFRSRVVLLYFASTFAYVGTEQGTANWVSQFLATYHGLDPQTTGAGVVSWFWGLMTAACAASLLLLKIFDSRRVLIGCSAGAIAALTVGLFGPASWSVIGFPVVGLFASLMWPVIISLGLNSVAESHGSVAGILCTGIVGGAVAPVIIGHLGDRFGLRTGMLLLYVTLGWVLSIGFWARPIIANQTIRTRQRAEF